MGSPDPRTRDPSGARSGVPALSSALDCPPRLGLRGDLERGRQTLSGQDATPEASPRPAKRPLRIALIGCGRISTVHLETLKALPDLSVVAVCDLQRELAEHCAAAHGIPRSYRDATELMEKEQPDVVHLLTPPRSHLSLAQIVLARRAHLYVEKPLASTEAEARRIVQLARETGVHVCPGHNRLFDPVVLEVRRLVQAGAVGRVVSVRAEQGFAYESIARSLRMPWSYTYEWGIFENLMPHPLYLALHFLDEPGEPLVYGYSTERIREARFEEIRVLIPSPASVAEVSLSLTGRPERNRLYILGTQGALDADLLASTLVRYRVRPLPSFADRFLGTVGAASQLAAGAVGNVLRFAVGRQRRYPGVRALIRAFYASLHEGHPPPVSLEAAVRTVAQMERIRTALEQSGRGRRIVVARPSPRPPEVLITGATGFLGERLARALTAQGVAARAIARTLGRAQPMEGLEWVQGDLTTAGDLARALRGVRTVFHCAALVDVPGSLEDYRRVNVRGTLELLRAAAAEGVETFLHVSSIGVYGLPQRPGMDVHEDAPLDPRSSERGAYTQSKVEAEHEVSRFVRENPRPRVIVLRPGTLYGPGAPCPGGRWMLGKMGRLWLVAGPGRLRLPLAYVDNVVDAMIAAWRSAASSGTIFNIVDDPDLTQRHFASVLRQRTRDRVRVVFVPPLWLTAASIGLDTLLWLRRGRGGTVRYRIRRTLADMRFPCLPARNELGWTPRVSLEEGIERTVRSCDII